MPPVVADVLHPVTQIIVIVVVQKEEPRTLGDIMDDWEREELMIRVDERVKTIFNRMEKFETLFTNHLAHHEMWENDIKAHMRWWIGVVVTAATGSGAMVMGVL